MSDESEVREALRTMLAERIDTLTPPPVYAAVRRRARRRQRVVVGGALVVALAAVAVPSYALTNRTAAPPADAPARTSCTSEGQAYPPRDDELPAQRDVPGSLGGDAAVVTAVLKAGWASMRPRSGPDGLDPGTARVLMAHRVEGQIMALVSASGDGRRVLQEAWVRGPDVEHLVADTAGAAGGGTPIRTRYTRGDVLVDVEEICGRNYVVVLAAPGTTGRAYWISAITPRLRAVRANAAVPLRADGIAVFRLDVAEPRFRLERAGRVVYDRGPMSGSTRPWPQLTDEQLARIGAAAPGDGDPEEVRFIADWLLYSSAPVRETDQRVLWSGRAGRSTVVLCATTLPGGVSTVNTASASDKTSWHGLFGGILAPGALERTVLAWKADDRGRLWAAYAVGGVRAEAVLTDGDVVPFALSHGGGVLSSPTAVARVRVYDAGGRLIGEQVPGGGVSPMPREAPL